MNIETPEQRADRKQFEAGICEANDQDERQLHDHLTWAFARFLRDERSSPTFDTVRRDFRQHIHLLENDLGIAHVDLDRMEQIHASIKPEKLQTRIK